MNLIEDFIGSTIEIFMAMILMNLFSEVYLKDRLRTFACIVLSAMLTAVVGIVQIPFLSILNYFFITVIFMVILKRNFWDILFEFVFSLATMMAMQYALITIFYEILGEDSLNFISRLAQLIISLAIVSSTLLSVKLQRRTRNFYYIYQEQIHFVGIMLFSFCAIELYLWKTSETNAFNQSAVVLIYTIVWFCLSAYLLKKLVENRNQQENIRLHQQYMETTENLLDDLYSEKHDFNKHLQAIYGICQYMEPQLAVDEIEAYIDALKKHELKKKEDKVSINTGNGVINALLYSKSKEAEKNGIALNYMPTGSFPTFPCETYELVQIIGNLIDNALEYLSTLEESERKAILTISEYDNKKIIEVRNTYYLERSGNASISHNKTYSTKQGQRRGYGLQNVKTITSKYNGKFSLYFEGNQFIVEVLF
ncbi:MAG: sensor histidine kinase [Aminipila sp.]